MTYMYFYDSFFSFSLSNENNFDGASGGVIQFTKNFKTLGEMLENEEVLEIEQRPGPKGMLPKKVSLVQFDTVNVLIFKSGHFSVVRRG